MKDGTLTGEKNLSDAMISSGIWTSTKHLAFYKHDSHSWALDKSKPD